MLKTICTIVITYLIFPIFISFAKPIILAEGKEQYDLGLHLELLEDPHGKFSFSDVSSPAFNNRFNISLSPIPSFGITSSVYWVRFRINNQIPKTPSIYLEVAQPQFDEIHFYASTPSSEEYTVKKSGDQTSFQKRDLNHRNFVFIIESVSGREQQIYLRLNMNGGLMIPLRLWTPKSFAEKVNQEMYGFGIYFGIMIIMMIYNFFLCISLRSPVYLHYVLFTAFTILFQMAQNGLDAQYLWQSYPLFAELVQQWALMGCGFFVITFSTKFLNTKKRTPRLHAVMSFWLITFLVGLVLPFIVSHPLTLKYNSYAYLLIIPVFIASGVLCLKQGVITARFFLIAWMGSILGIIVFVFRVMGIFPDTFVTEYAIHFGTIWEVSLFSLALADRINVMKKERESALMEKLKESEKVASLSKAFERFVPHEFLDFLNKDSIVDIALGDNSERIMSVLFSDIRSFTSLSEKMTPEENFRFLNSYLSRMGPEIRKYRGFIDKYIGDSIMALFSNSADDAVKASFAMLHVLAQYNQERQKAGYFPIEIGIGINTGHLILGTIGEHNRMDGTVISDAVNLAARIEGMTKMYGTPILISEHTFNSLENPAKYHIRLIDCVKVKGKNDAVTVYEIFDKESQEIQEKKLLIMKLFEEAISLYHQQDFKQAEKLFRESLSQYPEDKAAKIYIERCQYYSKRDFNPNWDIATSLNSK